MDSRPIFLSHCFRLFLCVFVSFLCCYDCFLFALTFVVFVSVAPFDVATRPTNLMNEKGNAAKGKEKGKRSRKRHRHRGKKIRPSETHIDQHGSSRVTEEANGRWGVAACGAGRVDSVFGFVRCRLRSVPHSTHRIASHRRSLSTNVGQGIHLGVPQDRPIEGRHHRKR